MLLRRQKCNIKDPVGLLEYWDGRTRKYTLKQVAEILVKIESVGLNPVVKEYGISKSTIRTWLRKEKNAKGVLAAYYKRRERGE